MKELKFYVSESNLTDYEKETGYISYKRLVDYLFNSMILCNNIQEVLYEVGEYLQENTESGNSLYDEEEESVEIYQYFLVDFNSSCDYDFLKKYCDNEIVLFYSEKLDCYVLGVTHFGTSWDYVLTDMKYTTEYEGSMQDKLYEGE